MYSDAHTQWRLRTCAALVVFSAAIGPAGGCSTSGPGATARSGASAAATSGSGSTTDAGVGSGSNSGAGAGSGSSGTGSGASGDDVDAATNAQDAGPGTDGAADGAELDSMGEGVTTGAEAESPDAGQAIGPGEAGIAHPCGSLAIGAPPDAGTSTLLPSLGLQGRVTGLWEDANRVLASDGQGWILWSTLDGQEAAAAASGTPVGLAGGIFAASQSNQVSIFSAADGAPKGSIPITGTPQVGLASDGSYLWVASATSLSAWSPSGMAMGSHPGAYDTAAIFAAPTGLLVALGPAGANVIETVSPTDGTSSSSPMFSGTFATWFADGTKFLSTVGTNIFVYTASASEVQLVHLSAVGTLGGGGSYFWNFPNAIGNPLDVYEIGGSGQPVGTYNLANDNAVAMASGQRLGILGSSGMVTILDLTATPMADQTMATPVPSPSVFAADSTGHYWSIGSAFGSVYFQGTASAPGDSGTLGCGQVLGLAGSAAGVSVVGTVSGGTLIFDVATSLEASVPITSGLDQSVDLSFYSPRVNNGLRLSSDGKTLAVAASSYAGNAGDRSLYVLSAPSWRAKYSVPLMDSSSNEIVFDFDMSRDATTLAETLATWNGQFWDYATTVTDISGAKVILSYSGKGTAVSVPPSVPLLSPSGSHIAVTQGGPPSSSSTTELYTGSTLVNAVPGAAVGWIDDSRLLVQTYVPAHPPFFTFAATQIYDASGNLLSSPPLPAIHGFDPIGTTELFSHSDQIIYDVATGAVVEATGLPGQSVVAGPFIVSVSGRSLRATRY
jgi:hypothetical protein